MKTHRLIYLSEIENLVIRKNKIFIKTVFCETIPNDSKYVIVDRTIKISGIENDTDKVMNSIINNNIWYKLQNDKTTYSNDSNGVSRCMLFKDTEIVYRDTDIVNGGIRILIRDSNIKDRLNAIFGARAKYFNL